MIPIERVGKSIFMLACCEDDHYRVSKTTAQVWDPDYMFRMAAFASSVLRIGQGQNLIRCGCAGRVGAF